MRKLLFAVAVVCLLATTSLAQNPQRDSQTAASAAVLSFENARGAGMESFEYVITGGPATASVVLQGCMSSGTCDTIETSTATTNTNRSYNFNYDYFTVTPTFSGGTAPKLKVNTLFAIGGTPQRADAKGLSAHGPTGGFSCVVVTATATTVQAVGGSCAAPGVGLSLYVTEVKFSASAAGIAADAFPTLKYGTGGTCGSGTAVFWGHLSAAAVNAMDSFTTPIKIPANNEICWISTTAGSKFLVITGFIAP